MSSLDIVTFNDNVFQNILSKYGTGTVKKYQIKKIVYRNEENSFEIYANKG